MRLKWRLTIEARFCVTAKVTKADPKPLLRTQTKMHIGSLMAYRHAVSRQSRSTMLQTSGVETNFEDATSPAP
jgi:hypothetical protein